MAARVARYAATRPAGEWITGGYWDHEAWPGKALPTREVVDAVMPDHPVFVKRLDGHMALANSLAMTLAGIPAEASAPSGGTLVRDARGRLTGIFKDAAMDLVTRAIPAATRDSILVEDARGAEARGGARRHHHAGHDGERGRARGIPGAAGDGRADGADFVDPELSRRPAPSRRPRHRSRRRLVADWRAEVLLGWLHGRQHGGVLRALCRRSEHARAPDPRSGAAGGVDRCRRCRWLSARRARDWRSREHARARHFRAPSCGARRAAGVAAAARARAGHQARRHRAVQAAWRGRVPSAQPLQSTTCAGPRRVSAARGANSLQRPVIHRRGRQRGLRDRLVRRAARPDAGALRRRHAPVPGRDASRRAGSPSSASRSTRRSSATPTVRPMPSSPRSGRAGSNGAILPTSSCSRATSSRSRRARSSTPSRS